MTVITIASPVTFKRSLKTAPNRFLKSAMTERLCTYSDDDHNERGKPTPEYIELYRVWGEGAIGTIVLGNIPVDRTHLEGKGNAVIDKRSTWDPVAGFKPVIAAAKAHGSLVIGQLTNGGRQTDRTINPAPFSASSEQCPPMGGMEFNTPRPMTVAEIDDLVDSFGFAAQVLHVAGADGVQLHCAHGYLLSQFLSGRVNKRTDDYGGSLENRARIVLRCAAEIRRRVPDKSFMVCAKMNSSDFSDGGLTPDESRTVATWLDQVAQVDFVELSGGSYEDVAFLDERPSAEPKKASTARREAYFEEFAALMKPMLKEALVCVTGGFRSAHGMNHALQSGSTDLIGIARPVCSEPTFCKDLISGKITMAKANKVPNAFQTGTSIYEIGCIGARKPLPDLADERVAQDVLAIVLGTP